MWHINRDFCLSQRTSQLSSSLDTSTSESAFWWSFPAFQIQPPQPPAILESIQRVASLKMVMCWFVDFSVATHFLDHHLRRLLNLTPHLILLPLLLNYLQIFSPSNAHHQTKHPRLRLLWDHLFIVRESLLFRSGRFSLFAFVNLLLQQLLS